MLFFLESCTSGHNAGFDKSNIIHVPADDMRDGDPGESLLSYKPPLNLSKQLIFKVLSASSCQHFTPLTSNL